MAPKVTMSAAGDAEVRAGNHVWIHREPEATPLGAAAWSAGGLAPVVSTGPWRWSVDGGVLPERWASTVLATSRAPAGIGRAVLRWVDADRLDQFDFATTDISVDEDEMTVAVTAHGPVSESTLTLGLALVIDPPEPGHVAVMTPLGAVTLPTSASSGRLRLLGRNTASVATPGGTLVVSGGPEAAGRGMAPRASRRTRQGPDHGHPRDGTGRLRPDDREAPMDDMRTDPGTARALPGWHHLHLDIHDQRRTLLASDGPADGPLCVLLHGRGNTARTAIVQSRADRLVAGGVRVVAPQGFGNCWGRDRIRAPGRRTPADDVAFLAGICRRWGTSGRVVVSGFSQGAAMAYRLGFAHPELIDLVVAVSGVAEEVPADGGRTPLIHVHGSTDPRIPLHGSSDVPSPLQRLRSIAARRGLRWTGPERLTGGLLLRAVGEKDRGRLELRVACGVGHVWPGGRRIGGRSESATSAVDATKVIIDALEVPVAARSGS